MDDYYCYDESTRDLTMPSAEPNLPDHPGIETPPRARVLIADDDPAIRLVLRHRLEAEQYAGEEAPDSANSLELLRPLPDRAAVYFRGRLHPYQGYDAHQTVFPVRLAAQLGARVLLLTNASGALRPGLPAGALALVESVRPDVAIIDISLKNSNGINLIRRIKDRHAEVRILVWSMYPENLYAERALRAGAQGYLHKGRATSQLLDAIRAVLAGKVYVSEELASDLLRLEHLRQGANNPVHLLDLAQAGEREWRPLSVHHCRDDCYWASLVVHDEHILLRWEVTGPRQREIIEYPYSWPDTPS